MKLGLFSLFLFNSMLHLHRDCWTIVPTTTYSISHKYSSNATFPQWSLPVGWWGCSTNRPRSSGQSWIPGAVAGGPACVTASITVQMRGALCCSNIMTSTTQISLGKLIPVQGQLAAVAQSTERQWPVGGLYRMSLGRQTLHQTHWVDLYEVDF